MKRMGVSEKAGMAGIDKEKINRVHHSPRPIDSATA